MNITISIFYLKYYRAVLLIVTQMDAAKARELAQEEEDIKRYEFVVDWYDPHPQLIRQYTLTFFPVDNSFEMVPFTAAFSFTFLFIPFITFLSIIIF